jgi:hypothetical protein
MTRKSRGTYVLAFGLVVLVGGVALAFLISLGWVLIAAGLAVAGVGVALLLLERTAAKAAAMDAPDRSPGPPAGAR